MHERSDDDCEDLSKGHVRHQEQARPLTRPKQSDRLSKTDESEPLSKPVPSPPLHEER